MTAAGRIGQFSALGISGVVVAWTDRETVVFALAGVAACLAATRSAMAARLMTTQVLRLSPLVATNAFFWPVTAMADWVLGMDNNGR